MRGDRERAAAQQSEARAVAQAIEYAHPGPETYAKVAAMLVLLTAVEVGVYYVRGFGSAMVALLLALAATKFTLVALFYMHLKFDSPLFARLFVGGMAIGASILLALLALFSYHAVIGG